MAALDVAIDRHFLCEHVTDHLWAFSDHNDRGP